MQIIRLVAATSVLIMLLAPAAFAGQPYQLEDLTVLGNKPLSAAGNAVRVDLQQQGRPVVSTVPDALRSVAGIDVQRRSILTPKSTQLRIRGMDERRSLIMLDGRPLNGSGVMGGQFVDWSMLDTGNWQAVEVGKGAFSARYGNTLGGTVNLQPAPLPEQFTSGLRAGYKRYGTYSLAGTVAGRNAAVGGRLAAGYLETDGHLRNSQAHRVGADGRLEYFLAGGGRIKAGVRYSDGNFNMPVENDPDLAGYDPAYPLSQGSYLIGPGIWFPSGDRHGEGSYYTKQRTELDLGLEDQWAGFNSETRLYLNLEERHDYIYSYNQGVLVMKRNCQPDRSWGWLTNWQKGAGAHRIGFGAEGNYLGYGGTRYTYLRPGYFSRTPTNGSDESDAIKRHGAYVDDLWKLSSRLEVYLGLRWEDYRGDKTIDQVSGYFHGRPTGFEKVNATFNEQALLPKAGLVYHLLESVSLFARFARATRYPDIPAFYWYYGGYRPEVDPDRDIVRKPLCFEDALQYEVGCGFNLGRIAEATLSYYNYRVDDYIRWIFGYSPSRVVYNIDRVDFQGLELDLSGQVGERLTVSLNGTWQATKKSGDVLDASNALSDELSELPEFKANLALNYKDPAGMEAGLKLRWVDQRQVPFLSGSDAPEGTPLGRAVTLKKLAAYTVVDLDWRYRLWQRDTATVRLTAGVENLFDESYEEEYGFPAPGQSFHLGVEIEY